MGNLIGNYALLLFGFVLKQGLASSMLPAPVDAIMVRLTVGNCSNNTE